LQGVDLCVGALLSGAMTATARDVDVTTFTDEATADAADQRSTADSWDATFCEVGFARIVGHGVPAELVAEIRAAARAFFFRPEDEKMRYHRPATTHTRSVGSFVPLWSSLAQGGHDDPLEGYTFHRPRDGWLHLDDPALDHPPEIASVAARYGHALEEVSHTLHRLSAAALQLPPDYFDTPAGTSPASLLVLSHYPPLSDVWAREPEKPRYRAHSDYTGFTLLLQDETDHGGPSADAAEAEADGGGGLEIDIDGRWTPVAPRPDSFIVNIGDLFELWTNKRWRSTPHRVASPRAGSAAAARSRVTAMLFTGPCLETIVQPAPTCGAPLFATMTAREHLTAMATSQSKERQ
jgi:isopenicillin N synthase-like dioxygenase